MKTPKFFILSSRKLIASPSYAGVFELEELFVNLCQAELLCPEANAAQKYGSNKRLSSKVARRIGKLVGSFHLLKNVETRPEDLNILIVIDVAANWLRKVESIPDWRQKFDLVVTYVWDAWLLNSFPKYTSQFDHLFIPNVEFQPLVENFFKVPVTALPTASDVLSYGAGIRARPIDVTSYGRTPKNYQLKLHQELNSKNSDFFYYHQISESKQEFPDTTYCSSRFDYLHRLQFRKILQRSKLTLAFDFNYTTSRASLDTSMKLHPSHKCSQSVLTRRWFENIGAGSVVVGKRPQSKMCDEYLNWPDSTIELPDDPAQGTEFIKDLLEDKERLKAISQRNYAKSLEKNDWRLRIRTILNVLDVEIPTRLKQEIEQMQQRAHALSGAPLS